LGGTLVFLAFPPWNAFFLGWLALVPTLWAARGTTPRQHFWIGLWAGAITNLGGFWWIGGMLMDFGHMHFVPAAGLTLLLAVYQGLVFALWLWLLARLRRLADPGVWLLAPIAFVVSEYVVWFVFPWYYANSQYNWIAAIQICELGGVSLLTFLLVLVNGALYDALDSWRRGDRRRLLRCGLVALAVCGLNAAYGSIRVGMVDGQVARADKLKIGLVEADVGIWEKEDREKIDDNLVRHQRMSIELERQGADLIVWPETSYHAPFTMARAAGQSQARRFRPIPRDVVEILQSTSSPPEHAAEDRSSNTPLADRFAPQRGFATPLLFGALTYRPNPLNTSVRHPGVDLLNSAILLDARGKVLGIYDKVYLLVFGEHIPLGETFPVFYEWLPEAGDLTAGQQVQVIPFGPYRIGVMVCYEDILPAFIRKVAAGDPNVLINVTNDAWFGKTPEPYLHLALAVFRTVEARLALVRSTNTGVSCFVDPVGRITAQTGLEDAESLLADVPMMPGGTLYQLIGDWPAWACLAALPLLWWRARRRQRAIP
jgi:apolipoprotein N-acyltransferase